MADAGIDIVLLEARKNLGGRAFSFRDKETGVLIDNSQHVLLGCCSAAIDFLSKIGSIGHVEFNDTINVIGAAGETLSIRSSLLPAPFHLLPSIMRTKYLSAQQKRDLLGVMARMLLHPAGKQENAREYISSLTCSDDLAERVISPISVSALNEGLDTASAKYARMVLVKALLESRFGYRLGIPDVPLSELIEIPAQQYLARKGCEIRTSAKVEKLHTSNGQVESITLFDGEELEFDFYVCAVPPVHLREIGCDTPAADKLSWQSIVSAHIFYDKVGMCIKHACLANEPFQWVFNKTKTADGYIQAVASAADDIANLARDEIIALALRAIVKAMPEMENKVPRHSVIVHENRATFSTGSNCDAFRPSGKTALRNLFLAGDWTDTKWPATIESAVRSGCTAAHAVTEVI